MKAEMLIAVCLITMVILMSSILTGCTMRPPETCECEMDRVLSERGPPDHVREYRSPSYDFTTWTYHEQKASYEFVLNPFGCTVSSDIRTSPTY